MISLIIAGGISLATTTQADVVWPDINNHTLKGEMIPSSKVVTRNMWGTPMLPDGTGGYSLIAPINEDYIAESLIIPPWNIPSTVTTQMVIYRPMPPMAQGEAAVAAPAPAPVEVAPVEQMPVMDPTAPVEPSSDLPAQ